MQRAETLRLAGKAVSARNAKYGSPEDNFERIARRWNAHLANLGYDEPDLTASSVAIMLADVKMARLENDPTHLDSWVDGAGYMACGAEVSNAEAVHGADFVFYAPTPQQAADDALCEYQLSGGQIDRSPVAWWRSDTREDARSTAIKEARNTELSQRLARLRAACPGWT